MAKVLKYGCPFCGGKPSRYSIETEEGKHHFMVCENCGAEVHFGGANNKEYLEEMWDKRVGYETKPETNIYTFKGKLE